MPTQNPTLTIPQYCERVLGGQDAIMKVLGEIIATHQAGEAILESLSAFPAKPSHESDLELHRRLGMEEGIQAVALYAARARLKQQALRAEDSAH